MMSSTLCTLTTVLLSLQAGNCYILLTANLEDFQAIAKQIVESPVATQLKHIFHRASTLFKQQLNSQLTKPIKRTDNKMDEDNTFEVWKPNPIVLDRAHESPSDNDSMSDVDEELLKDQQSNKVDKKTTDNVDATNLGNKASYYIQSIKNIFKDI